MSAATLPRTPVADRSVWTGADLAADPSWRLALTDAERAELVRAEASAAARGLALAELTPETFPLPALAPTLARIGDELRRGRGVALLSGFPVEGFSLEQVERMYYGMCVQLGTGVTQNSDASLIHYVTDGKLRPNQGKRGVGVPVASPLHVDLADVVSLLCIRQAPDEPPSWLGSSTRLYNRVLAERPEWLERLAEGFVWDRMGEEHEGEAPASEYPVPLFSAPADGTVSCRYNRYWMALAAKRTGGLSAEDAAMLDQLDAWAAEDRVEFAFAPGDVQFANNYTALHGRDAHDVVAEEERKRVLMRVWVDLDGVRTFADESVVRYGIIRHGSLGWTAAQLRRGEHLGNHPRRADGAPALAPVPA